MKASDPFFDSNTLIYLVSTEISKASRSEQLLKLGGTVSVQVLNEFVHVTRRKMKMPFIDIAIALNGIRRQCEVVPLTIDVHERGVQLAEHHRLRVYDAMIVAAAQLAGCTTLYSEDMHDGHVIDGLTIRNPYKGLP